MAKQKPPAQPTEPMRRELALISSPGPPLLQAVAIPETAAMFRTQAHDRVEAPKKIPIVKIAHKEGMFILPSGEMVEKVSGFVVYYFQTRRFYDKPPQPGQKGTPPTCYSANLIEPHKESLKKQADRCADCPHDKWGTGRDGRSKNCGTLTWLFLVNPVFGDVPLATIMAPPSSIRAILGTRMEPGYLARCEAKYKAYEIVWTTFGLETLGGAVEHSVLTPVMGPCVASVEEAEKLLKIRNTFVAAMSAMRGELPDVEKEADSEEVAADTSAA